MTSTSFRRPKQKKYIYIRSVKKDNFFRTTPHIDRSADAALSPRTPARKDVLDRFLHQDTLRPSRSPAEPSRVLFIRQVSFRRSFQIDKFSRRVMSVCVMARGKSCYEKRVNFRICLYWNRSCYCIFIL